MSKRRRNVEQVASLFRVRLGGMNRLAACSTALWLAVSLASILFLNLVCAGVTTNALSAADAQTTFNLKCASCHGRDGRGKTRRGLRTRTRDLTDASWQDDVSDERLFNSISNGRNKMPAFKKSISENEIDALVTYVRRLRR